MAGGALKYRHLGRKSSHRQALLRNLVTSLIKHEAISTTWPKAKEAQRLADKLITLAKRNTEKTRRLAEGILFDPLAHLPKLFTTLRERYQDRPGGYTRVLRIEPINEHNDQAPSAILELVDGPRDMRFALTARTVARERAQMASDSSGIVGLRDLTAQNIRKVTRFRPDGLNALERAIADIERRDKAKNQKQAGLDKEKHPKKLKEGG